MNMKKIYKKIAKKHGVTPAEVERDMKEAIQAAYFKPTLYAQCVPREGDIPTPEEFISYAAKRTEILSKIK